MSTTGSHAGRVPFDPDIELDPATPPPRRSPHRRDRRAQRIILAAVAAGGVLGAVSRYALSLALPTTDGRFPWGTFTVNVSGSVVLGFLLILLLEQVPNGRLARSVIGTGFLGAYTTFSTFMVESVDLIRDHHLALAVIYPAASIGAGLSAVGLGMTTARLAVRAERWLQEEMR